ncbi:MAG TPA: dual specificity protein phosphatase family protein [Kofleriaceae bacterium]|jgi:protein-tyrosine phosphatase|nr:dual specificity protein phosphatase family protein [Kofleriaceae bacterium]
MLDLSWITETLAIGGSFPPPQTPALARDHGVSAVVDLRGEACDDAQLLARHRIAFLHLPTIDRAPSSPAKLCRGVAFVTSHLSAGRRVLVHCAYGMGRSALLGLCVLVTHGYAPLPALALVKERRRCVSPSQLQYEGWAAWLGAHRAEHEVTWSVPTFDEFKAIAYRHLL